jgi:pyruvate dehydrogenase E1 component alpha subunit/2-oxoisovalerate dehydrogenase E1 component alpha subunit
MATVDVAPAVASAAYFDGDDETRARGLYQLLDEEGGLAGELPWLDRALARRLYEGMLTIRVTDARMMALQRQGRIGFYGEATGQEAAVVGSAAASLPDDWIIPALREAGVGLFRGMSLDSYLAQIFGNAADPSKGRQLPCHPCDRDTNYVVMSSCVSTQIPHAVGVAMGMKLLGHGGRCAFGYMGDGGTSEGDFHVALNFAGVMRAPVVLICQNNQWAISTPGSVQSAAETIALKALGYGVPPMRVDGNDTLAVYDACRRAAERARAGGGPTFVELVTYRVSAHSSSDDPSRYRDEKITDVWRTRRDPLRRMQILLERRGWLAAGETEQLAATIEAKVRETITAQERMGPPSRSSMFDDVYEEPTWLQLEQRASLG